MQSCQIWHGNQLMGVRILGTKQASTQQAGYSTPFLKTYMPLSYDRKIEIRYGNTARGWK